MRLNQLIQINLLIQSVMIPSILDQSVTLSLVDQLFRHFHRAFLFLHFFLLKHFLKQFFWVRFSLCLVSVDFQSPPWLQAEIIVKIFQSLFKIEVKMVYVMLAFSYRIIEQYGNVVLDQIVFGHQLLLYLNNIKLITFNLTSFKLFEINFAYLSH